jgi:hypothetical protein
MPSTTSLAVNKLIHQFFEANNFVKSNPIISQEGEEI